jgi:hypothetical protein
MMNRPGTLEWLGMDEQAKIAARLANMLRDCIAELRALDAHTIPTRAENLLRELGL